MLKETQNWLNKTYIGKTGFNKAPNDGLTRNQTYYGLIRALQIELKVGSYAGTFGPATERAISKQAEGAKPTNINYILQGGFWIKGYNPGALNGKSFGNTENTVKRFQRDIGIAETGVVTAQAMKSLLNTDSVLSLSPRAVAALTNKSIIQT